LSLRAAAQAIDAEAPAVLAGEAKKLNAALVHYSTDYVFGSLKNTPTRRTILQILLMFMGDKIGRRRGGPKRWYTAPDFSHAIGLCDTRAEFLANNFTACNPAGGVANCS
jgi:hypothetical protein